MNNKPYPCPSCNKENVSVYMGTRYKYVYCLECKCRGPHKKTKEYAIDSWNNMPRGIMTDKKAQVLAEVLANNCRLCSLCIILDIEVCPLVNIHCVEVTPQHWLDYAEHKAKEVQGAECSDSVQIDGAVERVVQIDINATKETPCA